MNVVGGFSLLRRLGSGARSEVWLGHTARRELTVAVKIFREHVGTDEITRELDALARADSPHLLRLLDVTTAEGRTALILQRLDPRGLIRRLGSARPLSAGELVTAMAPVASAVAGLHRAGVSHGSIRAGTILLDDSGAPVLSSFGAARLFADRPTPARLDAEPAVLGDRADLCALTSALLRGVGGSAAEELALLLDRDSLEPAELADRLFGLADGEPLHLHGGEDRSPEPVAPVQRLGDEALRLGGDALPPTPVPPQPADAGRRGWRERRPGSPSRRLRERLLPALARVRRPVWVAGGAGLAALVLAITLLASGSPREEAAQGTGSRVAGAHAEPPATSFPAPAGGISAEENGSGGDGPASADDPVAAAQALLRERDRCLDELSLDCLDRVDQADSAVAEADRAELSRLRSGDGVDPSPRLGNAAIVLVQRLGDSAILTAGETEGSGTTVLLVRGDGRWWIRDLVRG